jgi:vitamin B12 transporter
MSSNICFARATVLGTSLLIGFAVPRALIAQEADSIEEVIVVSSRIEVPLREVGTAVSIITSEDIELRGYSALADVLRTQPGIAVTNSGGSGKPTALRIRGEEGYRTLVMIDGVEMSDPTGTQVGPSFAHLLTTSDIERVEILRGSQGFIYGADAGGVINILTRTGEGDFGGQASAEFGEFSTTQLNANISGGSESGDYFVSISDIDSDSYNSRESDTVLIDNDGYENTTFHTKLGWLPTDDLRLQLVVRDIDALNKFDGCGFPTIHDCSGTTEQTTSKLSADYGAGAFTHYFSAANTDVDRANFAAGIPSFSTEGGIQRLEYTGSYSANDVSTFVYGVDLETEDIITSGGDDLERDQNGYYFEYQGRLSDHFFITAGARYDDNDDFGEHTSVRTTAAYLQDLSSGATLKYRASYGTGFRAPSLSEIAYNNGAFAFPPASDVTLSEETSGGYDIGFEYLGANGLYFEATYFDQEIEDEIFFDLSGFSGYLQSLGTSHSTGIELATEIQINAQWGLLGNLTYNDTENTEGQQRIRRPEQVANIGLRFSSTNERFKLLANYRLSRDSVDELFLIGRVPLDDYEIIDISATFAINDNLEAYGRLENVTDEDYQEVTGFNTPGSSAYAGLRVTF